MQRKKDLNPVLRKKALDAVENGLMSVEELLEEALKRSVSYANWLTQRLKASRTEEPRRPQIRRVERLPEAVVERALEVARRRLRGVPGVRHIGWGVKRSKGSVTSRDAVIVLVDQKRQGLKEEDPNRIPTSLAFSFEGKRYRVATDVRSYARHGVKQSIHPGNQCGVKSSGNVGTLSAVLSSSQNKCLALLSGHVAQSEGVYVLAHSNAGYELELGTVLRCRNDEEIDAAVAGPFDVSLIPYLAGAPTGIRVLPLDAPRVKLAIQLRGGDIKAFVDAVSEPVDFGSPSNPQPMRDLIRLDDRHTNPGDSGAPATDSQGRLVGFVVGCAAAEPNAREHTYLVPARRVIDELV